MWLGGWTFHRWSFRVGLHELSLLGWEISQAERYEAKLNCWENMLILRFVMYDMLGNILYYARKIFSFTSVFQSGKFVSCNRDLGRATLMFPI